MAQIPEPTRDFSQAPILNNLQVLRAAAAISVVLFHCVAIAPKYGIETALGGRLENWGASGVDIFFVVSGFVMVFVQNRSQRSALEFMKNRVLRIAPLYWLLTCVMLIAWILLPEKSFSSFPPAANVLEKIIHFAKSIAFSAHFFEAYPLIKVGWTLEYEMIFYILFSAAILIASQNVLLATSGAISATIALGIVGPLAVEFIMGMVLSHLFLQGFLPKKIKAAILLFAISIMVIVFSSDFAESSQWLRVTLWGIPAFFIVASSLMIPQAKRGLGTILGDASYAIYLIQAFSIPASMKILSALGGTSLGTISIIFVVFVTTLCGVVLRLAVEMPLTTALKRATTRNAS